MNEQTTQGPRTAVESYLDRLHAELADLPSAEVEEILEDVGPHLSELAAELGQGTTVGQLTDRLGTPETYAAELRAAAGYPPAGRPTVAGRRRLFTKARWALWALGAMTFFALLSGFARRSSPSISMMMLLFAVVCGLFALPYLKNATRNVPEVASLPEVTRVLAAVRRASHTPARAQVVSYLRSLHPGWWLLRAVLVAAVLVGMVGRVRMGLLLLLLLAIPIAVASVWLSRQTASDRRLLWLVVPINAAALAFGLAALSAVGDGGGNGYPSTGYSNSGRSGLWSEGRSVHNVYVFDADGKPLTNVYLYNQDGQPINVDISRDCWQGSPPTYEPPNNNVPKLTNSYRGAECTVSDEVPFTVVIPKSHPSTSTSASPTPLTSVNPSGASTPTPVQPTG